jgi:hypothetical protein
VSTALLGHRIQLEGMIPRNERALSEGVYRQAQTKPLGNGGDVVVLESFRVEYDAEFAFAA